MMDNYGKKITTLSAFGPKLIYYVDHVSDVHYLCIPISILSKIIVIAYGKGHLSFAQYYEIVFCF